MHLFEIRKQAAYPTVRESLLSPDQRWNGIKTRSIETSTSVPTSFYGGFDFCNTCLSGSSYGDVSLGMAAMINIPNSDLPWHTVSLNHSSNFCTRPITPLFDVTDSWGFTQVFKDVLGYRNDEGFYEGPKDAYTLSKITMPYGGSINIQYENGLFDLENDRNNWLQLSGFTDYCLPAVGHYNNIAHLRNILQLSSNVAYPPWSSTPTNINMIKSYSEFYNLMKYNTAGIRIKQIDFIDNFGSPTITKKYSYGLGHFTAPPVDYWQNYMEAFGEFTELERYKHVTPLTLLDGGSTYYWSEMYHFEYPHLQPELTYSEYLEQMMHLISSTRIDNVYGKQAQHYYEYIEELNNDNSKTRWYYGQLYNSDASNPHPSIVYYPMKYGAIKKASSVNQGAVYVLTQDFDPSKQIGNYKTELFDVSGHLINQTINDYGFELGSDVNIISTQSMNGLIDFEYDPYVNTDYTEGLVPITQISASFHPSILFEGLTATFLDKINYNSSGSSMINSIGEAGDPFLKIAYNCGFYTSSSSTPFWLLQIINAEQKYSMPPSPVPASDALSNIWTRINNISHYNCLRDANHLYFNDNMKVDAMSYQNYHTYHLYQNHQKTITNFY